MFQAASRYIPSQASLAIAATAARESAKRGLLQHKATATEKLQQLQQEIHVRFEKPDTTVLALLGTTFNLLNATTGPGLLALPLAFSRCGWLLGILLLLAVFALNHASLNFLLRACLTTREHSYIGLGLRAGPGIAALVDWCSLAFFFGSCVSYLVIIGDTFMAFTRHLGESDFFQGVEPLHFTPLSLVLLSGFTAVCLAPLSTLRSMDSLAITSGVAMLCILYAVAIVVIAPGVGDGSQSFFASLTSHMAFDTALGGSHVADQARMLAEEGEQPAAQHGASDEGEAGGVDEGEEGVDGPVMHAVVLSAQTLLSLPTMAFCFASQSLFPPALESLHQPATYEHMHSVVNLTMALTLLLHALVALCGYLRFGDDVTPNVLDSLPPSRAVSAAHASIVLAFAFTYPMMIFLCRMHIQSIMARRALRAEESVAPGDSQGFGERHTTISLLLVAGTLIVAILFPDIDALFGLLGGTTAVVISFVAPAVFWERFVGYMYPWRHPKRLFCKLLMAFAALVAALSLPGLLIDLLQDLYSTAWWVPVSSSAGLSSWSGGIGASAKLLLQARTPPPPPAPHGSTRAHAIVAAATSGLQTHGAAATAALHALGTAVLNKTNSMLPTAAAAAAGKGGGPAGAAGRSKASAAAHGSSSSHSASAAHGSQGHGASHGTSHGASHGGAHGGPAHGGADHGPTIHGIAHTMSSLNHTASALLTRAEQSVAMRSAAGLFGRRRRARRSRR